MNKIHKHSENLTTKDSLQSNNFFKNYEKHLTKKYPEVTVASSNEKKRSIVLNIQRETFSFAAFIILLLLLVLPGLIYVGIALFRKKEITLAVYFNNEGQITKVSRSHYKFIIDEYNKIVQ